MKKDIPSSFTQVVKTGREVISHPLEELRVSVSLSTHEAIHSIA
jgi:hypothetical protein